LGIVWGELPTSVTTIPHPTSTKGLLRLQVRGSPPRGQYRRWLRTAG
jgi:hypothetical protein